ncbi:MAG TPA: hypothetical protein VFU15_06710, partial [Bacteroidia bacterium]|nr:hypothetical protein [Bacteroidia bacterium]
SRTAAYCSDGLLRSDGRYIIPPRKFSGCRLVGTDHGLALFAVYRNIWKEGLIDGNGTVRLKRKWADISSVHNGYASVCRRDRMLFYEDCYNILDMNNGERLLPRKLRSRGAVLLSDSSAIVRTKKEPRVYSLNKKEFVTGHGMNDVQLLDSTGHAIAVKTCMGHIGIIDAEGKLIADTASDAITYVYSPSGNIRQYVFYADRHHGQIFDAVTGRMSDDTASCRRLVATAMQNVVMDSAGDVLVKNTQCPSLCFGKKAGTARLASWQEDVLFDSLYAPVRFIPDTDYYLLGTFMCAYCMNKSPQYFFYRWAKDYERDNGHYYKMDYVNDSLLSVKRGYTFNDYYDYNWRGLPAYSENDDLFFVTMLFNDGPHAMLLDSLFTGNDWKTIITNEILACLDSAKGVEGNCSNPFLFSVMCRERFLVTPEHLALFPPSYMKNGTQLEVDIPWSKLSPYLRKDVASKIGVRD